MVWKEEWTAYIPPFRSVSIFRVSSSPYRCSMLAGIMYGVRYHTRLADQGVSISVYVYVYVYYLDTLLLFTAFYEHDLVKCK